MPPGLCPNPLLHCQKVRCVMWTRLRSHVNLLLEPTENRAEQNGQVLKALLPEGHSEAGATPGYSGTLALRDPRSREGHLDHPILQMQQVRLGATQHA